MNSLPVLSWLSVCPAMANRAYPKLSDYRVMSKVAVSELLVCPVMAAEAAMVVFSSTLVVVCSTVGIFGSSAQPWLPAMSAPPWLSASPWHPAQPALPQSPFLPLPNRPGPPSLPLYCLRSNYLLDFSLVCLDRLEATSWWGGGGHDL